MERGVIDQAGPYGPPPVRRGRRRRWWGLLVAIALGIGLRLWVFELAIVEGSSMEPTLLPADRVLILKPLALQRFDVVVLRDPKRGEVMIKRIVGLPEETVSMVPRTRPAGGRQVIVDTGELYIDGVPYAETSATTRVPTIIAPWKLRPGRYYVLGDNRDVSVDSRTYGGVARETIRGVAIAIVWPLARLRSLPRGRVVAEHDRRAPKR